jgi:hypothetical protein
MHPNKHRLVGGLHCKYQDRNILKTESAPFATAHVLKAGS